MTNMRFKHLISKTGLELLDLPERYLGEVTIEGISIGSEHKGFDYMINLSHPNPGRTYPLFIGDEERSLRDLSTVLKVLEGHQVECGLSRYCSDRNSPNNKYCEIIRSDEEFNSHFSLDVKLEYSIQNPASRGTYESNLWFIGNPGYVGGISTLEYSNAHLLSEYLGRYLFSQIQFLIVDGFQPPQKIREILTDFERSLKYGTIKIIIFNDPRVFTFGGDLIAERYALPTLLDLQNRVKIQSIKMGQ